MKAAAFVALLAVAGLAAADPLVVVTGEDDDAGSGGDASSYADEAVPVAAGLVHHGSGHGEGRSVEPWRPFDSDMYALQASSAPAGPLRIVAELDAVFGCAWLYGGPWWAWPSELAAACGNEAEPARIDVAREHASTDRYYLRVDVVTSDPYAFAYALGGEPPQPARRLL